MIVGTAGHIDHGKTALVKALTGVDADRLAEEKERGVSIDIGFAYLPQPDGKTIGFVDMPGHERFMRNMLAGASGIDLVLLVVAADDGIMPQTREHIAVIGLLGITRGAIVLTKCDLVSSERRQVVSAELKELLAGSALESAPVFPVSNQSGEGIDSLRQWLGAANAQWQPADADGAFRFVVDRSFSLHGLGTIVTGTVVGGTLTVGDSVTISPSGVPARVRGLHAQNRPATSAGPGQRCGINLPGISARAIRRGDMLVAPELHAPTSRMDAKLELLPSESRPLSHWTPVRLYHGTADVGARVALLHEGVIAAGESGLVQLVLDEPIAAFAQDRFVIRDVGGGRTMGGGHLIDLRAPQRRRRSPVRLARLSAMDHDDPAKALVAELALPPYLVDWTCAVRDRALGGAQKAAVLAQVEHRAVAYADGIMLFGLAAWRRYCEQAVAAAEAFHRRYPQLLGVGKQRLGGAFEPRLDARTAGALLQEMLRQRMLAAEGGVYRLPAHRLGLDAGDQRIWNLVQPAIGGEARFQPPRLTELVKITHKREFDLRRVLKAVAAQGKVVEIAPEIFILRDAMHEVAVIVGELSAATDDGRFIASQLRDRLGGGRRVAIQMLEYFDRLGITLRRNDERVVDQKKLAHYLSRETR